MNPYPSIQLISLFSLLCLFLCALPINLAAAQNPEPTVSTNQAPKLRFRPPATGAPSVRVTGGSRGTGEQAVTLDVLVPNEVGLTTQEQPSLFWFQSKPANARFELTLLQEKKVKPVLEVSFDRSTQAGIQRLKLAEHGAKLVPGIEYQWVVALVTDPENRSSDLVASGVIKRIAPQADLKSRLTTTPPASLPAAYAEAGIWYDALATLSDQIEAHPEDKSLRKSRAELLRQVGLQAAAASEESQGVAK
jgi:hypothetical protein